MQPIHRMSHKISFPLRATLAATVVVLAGCAVLTPQRGANIPPVPEAAASSNMSCPVPIPVPPTHVPPPVTADSAGGYIVAVSSAALDDAMANSKAQMAYQQCLLKH
jgi:hypothetical protein